MSSEVEVRKPEPFDSFRTVYTTLVRLGCCKLRQKPSKRWKLYLHYFYRFFYFVCTIFAIVQMTSYMFLYCDDVNSYLDVLVAGIPQVNVATKFLTLYLGTSRFDKLHEVMKGPYFSAESDKDKEYMNKNNVEMNRLMKIINIAITVAALTWLMTFYLKKIQEENVVVPLILPVSDSWFGFSISTFTLVGLVYFLGTGHLAMDCLIATYYAQANTQLKILKHNLEHMFDDEENAIMVPFTYKDEKNHKLKDRLVYYVHKYDTIVWFTKELNSVFNISMSFQFLMATATNCFVIYALNHAHLFIQYIFLVILLVLLQSQVFLYCYYGSLVEYESQSVNQSAYQSDWVSLSPRFRRSLLIAMTRWTVPLTTIVSVVIPLSVNTFITIVKAAYSLYTLMSQTSN